MQKKIEEKGIEPAGQSENWSLTRGRMKMWHVVADVTMITWQKTWQSHVGTDMAVRMADLCGWWCGKVKRHVVCVDFYLSSLLLCKYDSFFLWRVGPRERSFGAPIFVIVIIETRWFFCLQWWFNEHDEEQKLEQREMKSKLGALLTKGLWYHVKIEKMRMDKEN